MSEADRCVVCGEIVPEGMHACPRCRVYREPPAKEPPAKYPHGTLVKMDIGDEWYYNHVVDSYYNKEIQMRMYRLSESMAMAIYREDWLEPVSDDELRRINSSGLLKQMPRGGWQHPYLEEVTS